MNTAKIKICGLTRLVDIEMVNTEKPDYVGFVFAESRRNTTLRQVFELRRNLDACIISVGVFANEPIENIKALVQHGVIDVIQLHGSENEAYIQKLKSMTNKPLIKAVTIQAKGDAQKWEYSSCDFLLFDNKIGGSGHVFNWNLIGNIKKPYFLAGGLTAENVEEAICKTTPFAVDVSSGVETDGFKDPVKMKAFIRRVRAEQ